MAYYIVLFSVGLVSFTGVPTTAALVNDWGLEGDDYRNQACSADNVGDNVGDVAGMQYNSAGALGTDSGVGSEPRKDSVTLDTFSWNGVPYDEVAPGWRVQVR